MISFPFNSRLDRSNNELNGEDGFPHSEIVGSKVAHTSPTLIAACHVLHRLYAPRHPRIALTSRLRVHTTNDKTDPAQRKSAAQGHTLSVETWFICLSIVIKEDRHTDHRKARKPCCEPTRSPHRFLEPIHNVKQQEIAKATSGPAVAGSLDLHPWIYC